jgi:hypothetical protein
MILSVIPWTQREPPFSAAGSKIEPTAQTLNVQHSLVSHGRIQANSLVWLFSRPLVVPVLWVHFTIVSAYTHTPSNRKRVVEIHMSRLAGSSLTTGVPCYRRHTTFRTSAALLHSFHACLQRNIQSLKSPCICRDEGMTNGLLDIGQRM